MKPSIVDKSSHEVFLIVDDEVDVEVDDVVDEDVDVVVVVTKPGLDFDNCNFASNFNLLNT